MERNEFAILTKAMKAVYSDPKFIADQDAFNVWYELLKDIPYAICQAAIHKYMSTCKFAPTIADIRQLTTEIVNPEELNEGEAWSLVYKAICNSAYNAREEFEKLPKECQRAVGNPSMLKEWATMDNSEVCTVIQSNFMRSYKVEVKRSKELNQLPPSTREVIAKLSDSMSVGLIEDKED
jgi:hypothetical protein